MEYPPYKFYKNSVGSKTTAEPVYLPHSEGILRLFSIDFPSGALRNGLCLKIDFPLRKKFGPFKYPFSKLYLNPGLERSLFFKSDSSDYTDIPLGYGQKQMKFSILADDSVAEYGFSLNCIYVKKQSSLKNLDNQENFDLLKDDQTIVELCRQCIESERYSDFWGTAFNCLVQEIESKIQRKIYVCNLPDELIVYTRIRFYANSD
jgi:hypothetical protein